MAIKPIILTLGYINSTKIIDLNIDVTYYLVKHSYAAIALSIFYGSLVVAHLGLKYTNISHPLLTNHLMKIGQPDFLE
jgi:hypothetical protein